MIWAFPLGGITEHVLEPLVIVTAVRRGYKSGAYEFRMGLFKLTIYSYRIARNRPYYTTKHYTTRKTQDKR